MKKILICLASLLFASQSLAQIDPQWIRYSAISPNGQTIAFTYKGDIYKVSAKGGEATRLTFHSAHDYQAVWSHDGKQIAFASDRFGNFDVFVMSALGGEASRLSFHSSNEVPYSFARGNQSIMFEAQRMDIKEHRQYPSRRLPELYSVPVKGGRVSQIFSISAEDVALSENGQEFLYTDNKGAENKWRKHHQSAATRDIWRYNMSSKEHQQITSFKGEDRNPVYTNDDQSMYYLSEQSGSFNVHRLDLNKPMKNTQITAFSLHPVRFLSNGRYQDKDILAFTHHGLLYTMLEGEKPKQVKVSIRTQDVANNSEMASIKGEISEMMLSPTGKEIAFIAQGEVFVSSTDGKFVKQITNTASQERFLSFSPEGDYLLYSAERNKNWHIYKATKMRNEEPFFYAATTIKETPFISNAKDNYLAKVSPDGKKVAYIEDRRTLKVYDIKSQKSTTLVGKEHMIHMRDGDQEFSWSPDSNWLLMQFDKLLNNSDIALLDVNGDTAKNIIVPSAYYDVSPIWVNKGKQIIWFSNRNGLKAYATSGRTQFDVYTMFFAQQDFDEFSLSEADFDLLEAIKEAQEAKNKSEDDKTEDDETEDDANEDKIEKINIDFKDLQDRTARLTIHSSFLSDAVLSKDNKKLYYLSRFEKDFDLWETDLRTSDTKKLISLGAKNGQLEWDKNHDNLYLLSDGIISKLDLDGGSAKSIGISEQVLIDKEKLYTHSFEHVWLRTSKLFYEPSYHGVDWPQMYSEYSTKIPHLANAHEYTELLSEMLGELNVSHSGAGFRAGKPGLDDTASLGVFYDYNYKGKGIKITEIINGGPLDKAMFDIQAGAIIEKIDAQLIDESIDWHQLLNRKENKFTLLDIVYQGKRSQVTVKPISLSSLGRLLYKRFVKTNEEEVLAKSKGRLGYVHIPNMADEPYRSIFDDMLGRFYDKEAMVIDARFNGGGDLVADLAMFFTGESFLSYATADKVVGGEPTSRYTKALITLFNENMYSDGHCYASGWKDLKLGKSVGMPVPGTCSFAGWEGLPMGGYWGVVPVSAKNKNGEWLENNQTDPDIIVKNVPGKIDAGIDQQLERAISEMMNDID